MIHSLDGLVRGTLILVAAVIAAIVAVRILAAASGVYPPAVAHAGGGIDGKHYTNSIAALGASYQRGFRLFEIDFLRTLDGEFVCGHDWGYFGGARIRAEELEIPRARIDPPPCTLDDLVDWFRAHPDSRLVSDAKSHSVELNLLLAERLPDQLIAQAYDFDHLCAYRNAGVPHTILTLYSMPPSIFTLLSGLQGPCFADATPQAVTMYTDRAHRGQALLVKLLTGLPVYTHTINSCAAARWFYLLGADQVYTDFLPAEGCALF